MVINEVLLMRRSEMLLARAMDAAQIPMDQSKLINQLFRQIEVSLGKMAQEESATTDICGDDCSCYKALHAMTLTLFTAISHFRACHRVNAEKARGISRTQRNEWVENPDNMSNRLYAHTYLLLLREFPNISISDLISILDKLSGTQEAQIPHLVKQWNKSFGR